MSGDDQVAWVTSSRRPSTPTASGDTRGGSDRPGVAPVHDRHSACASQKPLTLLRGVTCHVSRPLTFSNVRSEYAGRVTSGAYRHWRRIAGVEVVVDVRAVPRAAAGVRADEIPQAIGHDRTAERRRICRRPSCTERRDDTLCDQLRRQVVGLKSLAGSAREQRPAHRVAAGLRDDVHHESGGFRTHPIHRTR